MIIFVSEGAASSVGNFAHYKGGDDQGYDQDDHDDQDGDENDDHEVLCGSNGSLCQQLHLVPRP